MHLYNFFKRRRFYTQLGLILVIFIVGLILHITYDFIYTYYFPKSNWSSHINDYKYPVVLNSTSTRALAEYKQKTLARSLLARSLSSSKKTNTPTDTQIELSAPDFNTIKIELTNNATPINAGEVELFFDPKQLIVTAVNITDSLCQDQFVITKEINNKIGRIFYQCGTLVPFTGTSTTLAVISIFPQAVGASTLIFGSQTHILAHDGYGTNVLTYFQNAIYSNFTPTQTPVTSIKNE